MVQSVEEADDEEKKRRANGIEKKESRRPKQSQELGKRCAKPYPTTSASRSKAPSTRGPRQPADQLGPARLREHDEQLTAMTGGQSWAMTIRRGSRNYDELRRRRERVECAPRCQ